MAAADPPDVQRRLLDSHYHTIDHRFPIVANQSYLPPALSRRVTLV